MHISPTARFPEAEARLEESRMVADALRATLSDHALTPGCRQECENCLRQVEADVSALEVERVRGFS